MAMIMEVRDKVKRGDRGGTEGGRERQQASRQREQWNMLGGRHRVGVSGRKIVFSSGT